LSIFAELKRRNVFRVAIAYAVASWVLMQVVDVISPVFEIPEWAPKLIIIILAVGLVPVLVFAWAFELTPEGIKKDADVDRSVSVARQTGRKLNYVTTGFLVVAVILLLADRQLRPVVVDNAELVAEATSEESNNENSIAVLPFVNMSSDKEQDFFSDGITEEILNALASVQELKVAGRTSSFAFKGQNDDLRRIGDALGVENILEGSVRKSGATVRITAQLIRVDNGFHIWSETYDRELTDVFAIQDEIANEILNQLRSKLLPDAAVVANAQRTSPEVYELYLQAKQRIYTRIGAEIETAVEELDQAIQLDQEYAPTFAQRGIATMLLSDQQYGSIPDDEANRRAKRYLDQALKLDPNLAEAWAGLGLYHSNMPQGTDVAIDALVKALAINPNLIDASNWLQIALVAAGDVQGALKILEEIAERDPLYRPAFTNAIPMFNSVGRPDKAEALLKRMAALNPDNPDLLVAKATNFLFSGRSGEGLQLMEQRRELGNMNGVAKVFLSIGLMNTGQFERATTEGSPFLQPAALYSTGRKDEAFELAHEQARAGNPGNYFNLLVRANRDQDLVDYVEERWPSLSAFASEYPGNRNGYDLMADIALAYSRTGHVARFDEAMRFVDQRITGLAAQGINNFVFDGSRAVYFSMLGDTDAAFEKLQSAVDGGWVIVGDPVEVVPALAGLADDPRFAPIQAKMLNRVNEYREGLGLAPFDEDYEIQL
jgi:TolB-like protein/tetratricopeptide (TPR) repeat protein